VVVVPEVLLELEALLVLVSEVKSNFFPSTFTDVAGAFPNFRVTLVAELGMVSECDVEADKVPCQTVDPLTVTDIQALPVADKLIFGFEEAFVISQVEPEVVELTFLKLGVLVFFEEDFLDDEDFLLLLLLVLFELLPETLTELLSTLSLAVLLPLWEAATQIPTRITRTTMTMPITGIVRRNLTYRSST